MTTTDNGGVMKTAVGTSIQSLQQKKQVWLKEQDQIEYVKVSDIEVDGVAKSGKALFFADSNKGRRLFFWETVIDRVFETGDDEGDEILILKNDTNVLDDGSVVPAGNGYKRNN